MRCCSVVRVTPLVCGGPGGGVRLAAHPRSPVSVLRPSRGPGERQWRALHGGPGGDRAHAGVWATQLVGQQGGRSQYPAAARGRVPVFRDKQVAGQRHRVG